MGVIKQFGPVPPYRRMMIFIDGENLVCRYQDMKNAGYAPRPEVEHEKDVYVWHPSTPVFNHTQHIILRATYYTYAVGDEETIYRITANIKRLTYNRDQQSKLPNQLHPIVFKKSNREKKAKGVDIQMTVDILSHVFQNNIDTVCLLAGDGDYRPVIETVKSHGKQLYLAAFSSGLKRSLPHLVDSFVYLDSCYFETKPDGSPI